MDDGTSKPINATAFRERIKNLAFGKSKAVR
jgi:hypothetical protein